jgi:hypothetical protein
MVNASVSDLAREVYPAHTAKEVSRLMRLTLRTGRYWVECDVPTKRQQEFAQKLRDEFKRQEIHRAEILRRLETLAGAYDQVGTEMDRPVDGLVLVTVARDAFVRWLAKIAGEE